MGTDPGVRASFTKCIKRQFEDNTNMEQPTGWLYAVTCGVYEAAARASSKPHPYCKLGYVTTRHNNATAVIKRLVARYGTPLIDPRVLTVVQVFHPRIAEIKLFQVLQEHRLYDKREIFCADFERTILPAMRMIAMESEQYVPEEKPESQKRPPKPDIDVMLAYLRNIREIDEGKIREMIVDKRRLKKMYNICCEYGFASPCEVIHRLCSKLGLRRTMDNVIIKRSVIDDDLNGFDTLINEARVLFGLRASRARADADVTFKSVKSGINAVLRAWSDVELVDATDGSRSRSDGQLRATELRIVPGEFASLFVDGVSL